MQNLGIQYLKTMKSSKSSWQLLIIISLFIASFLTLHAESMDLPRINELFSQQDIKRIWIDCDPGNDDILAIIMAALDPEIQIVGMSTSAGNTHIAYTTQNTLDILKFVNEKNVAVYQGLQKPLLRQLQTATYIHGQNGLGGITFGSSSQKAIKQSVFWKIRNVFMDLNEPIIVLITGPMTNIAMLLRTFPEVKQKIKFILLMGGSIGHGNVSPAAQFNFYVDPQAAKMVFSEGIPIVVMPLDLTHQVLITQDVLQRLQKIQNRLSQKLFEVLIGLRQRQETYSGMKDSPCHDPTTIYFLNNSTDYSCREARIQIQTQGPSKGRSNCWFRVQNPNAFICDKTNQQNFWNYVLDLIKNNYKEEEQL